ncbi:WD40 repeat domain-containing protein [Microtetraspora malaysiensis]|uniref:WD40 repeat domain-containing protein n=1 Tax=Microtetraspora malaysiensis TaxID=161358 RepID=A0ABW6T8K5_9ACTN
MDSLVSERRAALLGSINVRAVALSADGRTALTSDLEQGVVLWALSRTQQPGRRSLDAIKLATLKSDAGGVGALALTPDGRTALTGYDDGSASIWDLADKSHPVETATLGEPDDATAVRYVALTPDGKTALIGHDDGSVTMWDPTKKYRPALLMLKTHTTGLRGLGLSADGRTVVIVSKSAGFVWDLTDRSRPLQVGTLTRAESEWEGVAVSADGRTVVTGSWSSADVWDVTDRAHPIYLSSLPGVSGRVDSVALSQDGRTALTSGDGGSTTLWELKDRSHPIKMAPLDVPADDVRSVALDAEGKTPVVGTGRWGAVVWSLDGISTDPLSDACADARFQVRIYPESWDSLINGEEWSRYFEDRSSFELCP